MTSRGGLPLAIVRQRHTMPMSTHRPDERATWRGGRSPPRHTAKERKSQIMKRFAALDHDIVELARRYSLLFLRRALGGVFIWFGALKVLDVSPVADLVASSLFFVPARTAVLATGMVEVTIGLGLVTGVAGRATLLLFFGLLCGTFSLLVTQPELAFIDANPLRLTVLGEFVAKNLVLIGAGFTLVASMKEPVGDAGLCATAVAGLDSNTRVAPPAWDVAPPEADAEKRAVEERSDLRLATEPAGGVETSSSRPAPSRH